jgi:hypothetical protein
MSKQEVYKAKETMPMISAQEALVRLSKCCRNQCSSCYFNSVADVKCRELAERWIDIISDKLSEMEVQYERN